MGHHLPAAMLTVQTAAEQMRTGDARGLAVTSKERLPDYPELPTFKEQGYPDLAASTWFALAGPAGMPADIVTKINAIVVKGFQEPDVQARLRRDGIEFEPMTAPEFQAFVHAEHDRWAPLVRSLAATAK
jgi:tripartite-type tricarboxylate transporter receptor subunit TctC